MRGSKVVPATIPSLRTFSSPVAESGGDGDDDKWGGVSMFDTPICCGVGKRRGITFDDLRVLVVVTFSFLLVSRSSRAFPAWEVSPVGGVQSEWWWVRQAVLIGASVSFGIGVITLLVSRFAPARLFPRMQTSQNSTAAMPRTQQHILAPFVSSIIVFGCFLGSVSVSLTHVLCTDLFAHVGWSLVGAIAREEGGRSVVTVQGGQYDGLLLTSETAQRCAPLPGDFAPPFYMPWVASGFIYPLFLMVVLLGYSMSCYLPTISVILLPQLISGVAGAILVPADDSYNMLALLVAVVPVCCVSYMLFAYWAKSAEDFRAERTKRQRALDLAKQRSITAIFLGQLSHDVAQSVHCALEAAQNLPQISSARFSHHTPFPSSSSIIPHSPLPYKPGPLVEGGDAEEGEEEKSNLLASLHLASRLLADGLDLAALAEDRLRLDPLPVHLPPILHRLRSVGEGIGEAKVKLVVGEGKWDVVVDVMRLEQIILNALSNAAKHAPPKSTIQISVQQAKSLDHLFASELHTSREVEGDGSEGSGDGVGENLEKSSSPSSPSGEKKKSGTEKGQVQPSLPSYQICANDTLKMFLLAEVEKRSGDGGDGGGGGGVVGVEMEGGGDGREKDDGKEDGGDDEIVWVRFRVLDAGKGLIEELGKDVFHRFEQQTREVRQLVEEKMAEDEEERSGGRKRRRGGMRGDGLFPSSTHSTTVTNPNNQSSASSSFGGISRDSRYRTLDRLQGRGLGLSMVAHLVQLMHGAVGLRNHADGGAEFDLLLPLPLSPTPLPTPHPTTSAPQPPQPRFPSSKHLKVSNIAIPDPPPPTTSGSTPTSTTSQPTSPSFSSRSSRGSSRRVRSRKSASGGAGAGAGGMVVEERVLEGKHGVILVADDQPLVRKMLSRLLTKAGAEEVLTFENGEDVVEEATKRVKGGGEVESVEGSGEEEEGGGGGGGEGRKVLMVISDVDMGAGMNGFGVARSIAALDPSLPVILISANTSALTREKSKSLSVVANLRKPFTNKELCDALTLALQKE